MKMNFQPGNQYPNMIQILKGSRPVSILMRNRELLEYWRTGSSWEPTLNEIDQIEYKKQEDDEYLQVTFRAATANPAFNKALQNTKAW